MSKKKNDWKNRDGIVYSTSNDFEYQERQENTAATLPPKQQQLKVSLDTSGRAGKQVSMISGFVGNAEDLEKLGRTLRSGCGTGGSVKDGVILIQGDNREKLRKMLLEAGYKVR